jgi:ribose transport system ATP-binding protein
MTGSGSSTPVLAVSHLSKTFPGQAALTAVDFDVVPGEVRALVGQNGSGKSTLIKILAGYHAPDAGSEVTVAGYPLTFSDPRAAMAAGLRFVHQDLALIPALDTLDNVALGRGYERARGGTISWRREAESARVLLHEFGYDFDLRAPVSKLTASERTGIAIVRALQGWEGQAHVLFLDEPTAALPASEVQRLFEVIRMVQRRGVAVVYISHHFSEVFEIGDRVTVLRDGRVVTTRAVTDLDEPELIELTVGRAIRRADVRKRGVRTPGDTVALRVRGLTGRLLRGIDLDVHTGEVVGVAGITGSGREELASLVFGAAQRGGGVEVNGYAVKPGRPDRSVARGMVFVPADRLVSGILADMSVRENLTIGSLLRYMSRLGLRIRAEIADAETWLERLQVVPRRSEAIIARLSGGNQQKVMLGRALRLEPRVLVLDGPTQGVDVGAKAAIHDIIDGVANRGAAVLVASTESAELVRLCDRVLVLAAGRVQTVCIGAETSPEELEELTMGGALAAPE